MVDLRKLQQTAKERQADGVSAAPPRRRRRVRPWRIAVWLLELLIVLVLLEEVIIKPRRDKEKSSSAPAANVAAVTTAPERRAVLFGDSAVPLADAREVADALLPDTASLAPGCVSAQAAQEVVARDHGLPVEIENNIGMRFRLIPNGAFLMGSPATEPGRGEGEVQHVRSIPRPFYMAKFEVTQAQWKAVLGEDVADPSRFVGPQNPVEEVTWTDCMRFAAALCKLEGVPVLTYRLPTEAEWEYACRAGSTTAFHFGDSSQRLRVFDNYEGTGVKRTSAVGQYRPNAYGLYDMHGNVWEWCLDEYKEYPDSPVEKVPPGVWRVIRGGNWYVGADECRSANRARLTPTSHGNMLGLRLVRSIPEILKPEEPEEQHVNASPPAASSEAEPPDGEDGR